MPSGFFSSLSSFSGLSFASIAPNGPAVLTVASSVPTFVFRTCVPRSFASQVSESRADARAVSSCAATTAFVTVCAAAFCISAFFWAAFRASTEVSKAATLRSSAAKLFKVPMIFLGSRLAVFRLWLRVKTVQKRCSTNFHYYPFARMCKCRFQFRNLP